MHLESYFEEGTTPDSEGQEVCRSALTYLFATPPDEEILKLLLSSPDSMRRKRDSTKPLPDSTPAANRELTLDPEPAVIEADLAIPQTYQLSELIAAIIGDDEAAIDNALAPFPVRTRALVECLLLVREGDASAAKEQLELADLEGTEAELIQNAIARSNHARMASSAPARVKLEIPRFLDISIDENHHEIIGVYTNDTPSGAIFVEPQIVVRDGILWLLSAEDRDRLFPESGAVMTHRKQLRRHLKRGDLVHWSVAEKDGADGRTRFHMINELTSLTKLVRVPVPSSDPDEVRNRIKSHSSLSRDATGNPTAFLLSDGVVVAAPTGMDFSRDEAFDHPWHAWSSLTTWLIEGNQYCLSLPTDLASTLDLSTLDAAFRHILKTLEAEQKLTLTKSQKRELSELIRSQLGSVVSQRARRVAAALDEISILDTNLDAVIDLLGVHQDVARRVDELIDKELESRQDEKAGIESEISQLRKKATDLRRKVDELARASLKEAEATSDVVREAFNKAIRDGAMTIANAEIFRLLAPGKRAESSSELTSSHATKDGLTWIRNSPLSDVDVATRLSALGIGARQSTILLAVYEVTRSAGIALIVRGRMARQCIETLACHKSDQTMFFDVPMGLTSGEQLRNQLQIAKHGQAVAILNADLSPPEVYGGGLMDLLFEQAADTAPGGAGILLSCVGGPYSVPLPNSLKPVALTMDIDSDWDVSERLLEDIEPHQLPLLAPLRVRMLQSLRNVDADIREFVERALVKALV